MITPGNIIPTTQLLNSANHKGEFNFVGINKQRQLYRSIAIRFTAFIYWLSYNLVRKEIPFMQNIQNS